MTATRCDHCPRVGVGPCRGESLPRLCELVDATGPAYRPEYLAALAPPDGVVVEPPRLPTAVAIEATRRGLLNCPDGEPPDCSCEGAARCRRDGRVVVLRDCAACLGLTDPPPPAI